MRLLMIAERPIHGANDTEDQSERWEQARTVWFNVEPLSGSEREQADQSRSLVTHRASCQYFQGATASMRLVSRRAGECRIFNVESVTNENERNQRLNWRLIENA